jgi:hypothetical protein
MTDKNQWLLNLKKGDKVIIKHGYGFGYGVSYQVCEVTGVTPKTKKIKVDGRTFHQDGGGSGSEIQYRGGTLMEYNDANRKEMRDAKRRNEFRSMLMGAEAKRNHIKQEVVDKHYDALKALYEDLNPADKANPASNE